MSFFSRHFSLLLLLVLGTTLGAKEREIYDESLDSQRKFHLFGGPDRKGPEAQWENIQEMVTRRHYRSATRHSGYLVDTWPEHPLAVKAQRLRADLYFARGRFSDSFDAYQGLIDRFSGQIDYEEVLALQLECARRLETKKFSAFFGLGSYTDPLEAVPLYRQLLTNAPRIEMSPEILLRIGKIQYDKYKYSEAIIEFDLLEQRYPRTALAEEAAYLRASAFEKIALKHPTDLGPQESALQAISHFLETYPNSSRVEDLRQRRRVAYERLALERFEQGRFYEKRANNPAAAIVSYQSLLTQFPDSEWTAPARERILSLTPHAE